MLFVMKDKMIQIWLVLTLFSSTFSFAAALYEYNRPVRALGMGGVYLNFVKDTDAPTINPAALGFVSGIAVEVANVGLGINGVETIESYQNSTAVNSASDYDQFFGKKIRLSGNARVSAVMPNFGLSLYDDAQVSMI
jgi:hypothetical protein